MPRGGYRPGAGRPPGSKTHRMTAMGEGRADPLAFLLGIVADEGAAMDLRMRAAIAALPYCHARAETAGKREREAAAAQDAEAGTAWEKLLRQ